MELKKLAVQAAEQYAQIPNIEAVMLAGSVSRDWQDEFSDIELLIFWRQAPSDEERQQIIRQLGGKLLEFHPYEEQEWAETYTVNGMKFEISSFLTETISRTIHQVTEKFAINPDLQCIIAAVQYGISLYGDTTIEQLKKQVEHYPLELQEAGINYYSDFGSRWNNREALVHRKDWLMFYKVVVSVQTNIMGLLFGLNRQFIPHPAFKWQRNSLALMDIKPKNCAARLESVFFQEPSDAIKELEALIGEIFGLIRQELPHIDLSEATRKASFVRPKI
ncbi:DUF4037 domain-containing protein [Planococcus citreus]|uniref:Uncharacterized protein DUF4037 n=1 Tax=Planococcus citreus TaxID=1373 RepID=A0A497YLR7_9BACL|nr:DUF4037 domain-containing protein [Planococcus citreus]RLJ90710.1 uncharacterized protein DUF4037 [Planococcus citreus]